MLYFAAMIVQILAISALFYSARDAARQWRLAVRREAVLLASLRTFEEMLERSVRGTLEEDELRLGAQLVEVGLKDELSAQVMVRRWTKIPRTGEAWPDEMLADVLEENEV